MYCIRVEGKDNYWSLCAENKELIDSFRAEVVLKAMASHQVIVENPVFPEQPEAIEDPNWSWAH